MRKVTLEELFRDAPCFRTHESLIGAKYRIKNPNDPNAPGLWFAKEPSRILVAKRKPYLHGAIKVVFGRDVAVSGDEEEFAVFLGEGSKQATLREYDFIETDVAIGDAVEDYHLDFKGSRAGWNFGDSIEAMFRAERENGALIRTVIPAKEFHAKYELDEANKCYREKSYQKKYVEENLLVEMPGNGVEQVAANCEVVWKDGEFTWRILPVDSGFEERLICGQPLRFYTQEVLDMRTRRQSLENREDVIKDMALMTGGAGFGFRGMCVGQPGQQLRNPYGALLTMYGIAKNAFNEAGMVLSPQQKREFDCHMRDIARRHAYFQSHPVIMGPS